MPGPYHPQHTPDIMLAGLPLSEPLGPGASLGLGPGWCIDFVADDFDMLAPYELSQDNTHSGLRAAEAAQPPCFHPFHERATVSTSSTFTPPPRTVRKRARRRIARTDPPHIRLGTGEAPDAHSERPGAKARHRKQKAAGTMKQSSDSTQLIDINGISGSSAPQRSAHASSGQGDGPPADGGPPHRCGKKRSQSATHVPPSLCPAASCPSSCRRPCV
ncbi:hypothetical protein ColTof3_12667 [Colletotrichum tofieldiae]|nr:hypothetical protein ColTof3_12667 [Colletotrichum tofieldiae]